MQKDNTQKNKQKTNTQRQRQRKRPKEKNTREKPTNTQKHTDTTAVATANTNRETNKNILPKEKGGKKKGEILSSSLNSLLALFAKVSFDPIILVYKPKNTG